VREAVGKVLPLGVFGDASPTVRAETLSLPDVTYAARGVRFDAELLARYQSLFSLLHTDEVPAGFTHVTAFPVAMALMVAPEFPLPLMGMVHLSNRVEVARTIRADEECEVFAWAQNLAGHAKGTSVELVVEVQIAGSVVWRGTSTYLAKGKYLRGRGVDPVERAEFVPGFPTAQWNLGAGVGRDYAAISGDRNPIHMSALSAKAFGFPRAIAHGMYTAARALAEARGLYGESYVWEVDFAKPVLLPSKVAVAIRRLDGETVEFSGWNGKSSKLHFSGAIKPLT
jgi:acyl dehydratase